MSRIKTALLLAFALMLIGASGCEVTNGSESIPMTTTPTEAESDSARFSISCVAEFADKLAYHDKRGIYVIKDKRTGKEYIGVSGIGISELGKHGSDDDIPDER